MLILAAGFVIDLYLIQIESRGILMYDMLFNEELQKNMLLFFLEKLAKLGSVREIRKNEIIDPPIPDQ